MNSTSTDFSKKRTSATLGTILGVAFGSVLLLCGAGLTPTGNVQTSDVNANGFSLTNAATISAGNFVGNGAGLTNLPPSLTFSGGLTKTGTNVVINYGTGASTAAQGNDSRITGAVQSSSIDGATLSALGHAPNTMEGVLTVGGGQYQITVTGTMTPTGTSAVTVTMMATNPNYTAFELYKISGQSLACCPTITGDFNVIATTNTVFMHAASVDYSSIATLRGMDAGPSSPGDSTITMTSTFPVIDQDFSTLTTIQGGNNDGTGNSDGSNTSGHFATYAGNAILEYADQSSEPSIGVTTVLAGTDSGTPLYDSVDGGYAGNAELLITDCTTFTSLDLHTVSSIVSQNDGWGAGASVQMTNCPDIASLDISGIRLMSGGSGNSYQNSNASLVVNLSGLSSVSLSSAPVFNDYTTISFNGCALPISEIGAIIQWCADGFGSGGGEASNSSIDLSGGTNASPVIVPEIDLITIDSHYYDGDTVVISSNDGSINLTINYVESMTFDASNYSGGILTVGIFDSPTIDQLCDLIAATLSGNGGSATYTENSSGVITSSSVTPTQWPLTISMTDGTTQVTVQNGIDVPSLETLLASYGPSLTTN